MDVSSNLYSDLPCWEQADRRLVAIASRTCLCPCLHHLTSAETSGHRPNDTAPIEGFTVSLLFAGAGIDRSYFPCRCTIRKRTWVSCSAMNAPLSGCTTAHLRWQDWRSEGDIVNMSGRSLRARYIRGPRRLSIPSLTYGSPRSQ